MNGSTRHFHLLGICGTGMTALASLLTEAGYRVTGSDQNVYPPMSTHLERLGVTIFEGYRPEHLDTRPDVVVVGNVIRKDNREAQEVIKRGIPYLSMPQVLSEFFLATRTPVVIAGTHGKTTLSTLAAWLIDAAGGQPGFFIGGIGRNFNTGARIGHGPFFVVEGDEYDTAFFDKGPKFVHYRPRIVLLTSIEFDHADIYRNVDHLMESFTKLIRTIPPDGLLIACTDYETVRTVMQKASCKTVSYGLKKADYTPKAATADERGTTFTLSGPHGSVRFRSPLYGQHNLQNVVAATAFLMESGISPDKIQEGLNSFLGIARRQEVVGEANSITVIDDFAHHPTAVQQTIAAVRTRYPGRRVWAIFEPRSNTSRRNIFQSEFVNAFKGANHTIIAGIHQPEKIPAAERLDTMRLSDDLRREGVDAHCIPDAERIVEFVLHKIKKNDVILVMSNGSFGGLPYKLFEGIKRGPTTGKTTEV